MFKPMRTNFFRGEKWGSIIIWCLILLVFIVFAVWQIVPIVVSFFNASKGYQEYIQNKFWIPKVWDFSAFGDVFSILSVEKFVSGQGMYRYGFGTLLVNSLLIAFVTPVMGVLTNAVCGYILAHYNFRFKKLLLTVNVFVMIIPFVGTLPAALQINRAIGRYDNFLMMSIFGNIPFGFNMLLFLSSFNAFSWTYAEAAMMDGAGHLRIMFLIMMPMRISLVLVMYVLAFLGAWNDYNLSLVWLPSMPNLAYGVYNFQYNASVGMNATPMQIQAALLICALPSLLLYLVCQKGIASKLEVGGIKG